MWRVSVVLGEQRPVHQESGAIQYMYLRLRERKRRKQRPIKQINSEEGESAYREGDVHDSGVG